MNTVGWAGGALGPLAIGIATKYGRHGADTVANMSEAIPFGAVVYLMGGLALLVLVRRGVTAFPAKPDEHLATT
jgi:hypothetical protein